MILVHATVLGHDGGTIKIIPLPVACAKFCITFGPRICLKIGSCHEKRIATLQSGLEERRHALVFDVNISIADDVIQFLMALFLHILECRHVHNKPLKKSGDSVRTSKE